MPAARRTRTRASRYGTRGGGPAGQSQQCRPEGDEGEACRRRGRDEGPGVEERASKQIGQEQYGARHQQEAGGPPSRLGSPGAARGGWKRAQERQVGQHEANRRHRGHVPDWRFAQPAGHCKAQEFCSRTDSQGRQKQQQQRHQRARGVDGHAEAMRARAERQAGAEEGCDPVQDEQQRRARRHLDPVRPEAGQEGKPQGPAKKSEQPEPSRDCAADANLPQAPATLRPAHRAPPAPRAPACLP